MSVKLVAGLGFGDEGKGQTVHNLVRDVPTLIVRYNGGAQAAHNVYDAFGRHHTFSQIGAGSFQPNVTTYLSRFMMVNVNSLLNEAQALAKKLDKNTDYILNRIAINPQAPIITPYHKALNHWRERQRIIKHGSCGMGIGECKLELLDPSSDPFVIGDLFKKDTIAKKLRNGLNRFHRIVTEAPNACSYNEAFLDSLTDEYFEYGKMLWIARPYFLQKAFSSFQDVIFEGAQGVLLDEKYGFAPHTTWSDCTFNNAYTLLDEVNYKGDIERIGVLRVYATRHGIGPFVTEDSWITSLFPDKNNPYNESQKAFRVGFFDVPAVKYALYAIRGVDKIILTCYDQIDEFPRIKVCTNYVPPSEWNYAMMLEKGQIRQNPNPTQAYQTHLANTLAKVIPSYEFIDTNILPDVLSEILEVPIEVASFGRVAQPGTAPVSKTDI